MVSHLQGQILVDLLEMLRQSSLGDGWVLVLCFHSAVGIPKRAPLTMSLGLSEKRFALLLQR